MEQQQGASRSQVLVMAATGGINAANIYYNQPILSTIAHGFHASQAQIGNLPGLTQIGYGVGLALLTPLGDMIDRRRLTIVVQLLLAAVLVAMTFASSLAELYVESFLVGMLAVSVQIVMPMAASLASKETKGKVVGTVFTGVLTGILSARIASGYVAEWLGWRWVYGLSAVLVLAAAIVVALTLPRMPVFHRSSYLGLLRSTFSQFARFATLRRAALVSALVFGVFCSFWTTLTFHLSGAPFYYRSDIIGLFGVLAIAGTLAAPLFGRLADRRDPVRMQILTVGLIVLGVLSIQWWPDAVSAFIVATILIDIGVQTTQVTNFAQIYGLDEAAHSRINTVFVTAMFIGRALGTYAGVLAWSLGGWALVCWQMLLWSLMALVVIVISHSRASRGEVEERLAQQPGACGSE